MSVKLPKSRIDPRALRRSLGNEAATVLGIRGHDSKCQLTL